MFEFVIALRELHGGVDRRVIGHVEKQDLRRADGEKMEQALVALTLVETFAQSIADGAEAAEGDDADGAGERLVARRQVGGRRQFVEHVVERHASLEGFRDRFPGEAAGAETRLIVRLSHGAQPQGPRRRLVPQGLDAGGRVKLGAGVVTPWPISCASACKAAIRFSVAG